ncbi:hypothetical protein ACSEE7_20080 [Halomonas cupida]|uniref:hypothetical protein n=1 Tax=Halomonas cupida TaxID=44933 RepID=UPI003EF255AF
MRIKRTLQGLAATSLLVLATGCAVPQSAGSLQGVAVNAIGGVADAISGRSASAAGAQAAGQMGGVSGMMNGGSAAMSSAAYGAAGAVALGVVDQGMRGAFAAMQGEPEVGFEDVANMRQNVAKSDPYVDAEGRTCIDYNISVTGGPADSDQNVTTCQNASGDWEKI